MNLVLGEHYNVVVVKFVSSGVVVSLEDQSTELIHTSRISDKYVKDPANFVQIGQKLDAECVEGRSRPLELSLKHLNLNNRCDKSNTMSKHDASTSVSDNKSNPSMSLDDMIAQMNAAYDDKMRSKHNRDARRANTMKSKRSRR